MKRKAFTFDITFLPIIRTSLTFTVHVLRGEARKRREDRNQSHRGTDPLALSLWSIFKICFPSFRYHKRERLSHTGNFDTGHFHVGRGVRVRERPPRGDRGREEDRDGDQSLSAFQFARSKNGGEREREREVGCRSTGDRFFLRFCNAIKALLRFSRQSFDFLSDVSAE